MDRDFNSEMDKIDNFIDLLTSVADADGKVTVEEQSLMDEIMNDLSDYRLLVMEALEDNMVSEEEAKSMKKALDNIVTNASRIALADGNLSDDEEHLINSLITFAS